MKQTKNRVTKKEKEITESSSMVSSVISSPENSSLVESEHYFSDDDSISPSDSVSVAGKKRERENLLKLEKEREINLDSNFSSIQKQVEKNLDMKKKNFTKKEWNNRDKKTGMSEEEKQRNILYTQIYLNSFDQKKYHEIAKLAKKEIFDKKILEKLPNLE
jgi:hypothetical protein